MNDLISRQAAIDALDAICDRECEYSKAQRSVMCGACRLGSAFDVIDELPSAQPTQTNTPNALKALDCVSRQAAINNIKNGFHWETVNGIMAQAVLKQVIHDIEIMPSVQPEIIRCKDCRYYGESLPDVDTRMICHKTALNYKPDDFCSYAERREDG